MSFSDKSLSRDQQMPVGSTAGITGVGMSTWWRYATADAAATVETAGYFNNARSRLAVGDSIDAVMVIGGTPVKKSYVVLTVPAAGSNITIGIATATAG